MISLQQIATLDRSASKSALDNDKRFLNLTIPESNATQRTELRMCITCPLSARVLHTPSLHIQFFIGYDYTFHGGLKMYLSALPADNYYVQLPGGLFNCSVNNYSDFQQHLDCNLWTQCEDGRDETEHCAFSSPLCKGLVASHNKCFHYLYMDKAVFLTLSEYECQRIGGRPASMKTRKEQADFRQVFKRHVKFRVTVGAKSDWRSVPFIYSMFRKWSDNTLIYNIDHFVVGYKYIPSRRPQHIDVESLVFKIGYASTSKRCDQFSDCLDNSDEVGCPDDSSYLAWFKDDNKKHMFYVNLDGAGYFTQQRMSSDDSCPHSHYRCPSEWLYCLPVYTRCNGFSDCIHGEDEHDCDAMACPGFYQCQASRICVHGDHLCDGWGQCPQRDDELACDVICPEDCLCQGHVFLCNRPFPSDLFPELRYLDAMGSHMTPTYLNFAVNISSLNTPVQ
ncbi:hypothetical protein ACOMHN_067702 [Nucella lapillus]